jgi:hypothetical protein
MVKRALIKKSAPFNTNSLDFDIENDFEVQTFFNFKV